MVEASWLQSEAEIRWKQSEVLRAQRGSIYDRNGKVLAEDSAAYTVAVDPQIINERGIEKIVAKGLADLLGESDDPSEKLKLEQKMMELVTRKRSDGTRFAREVIVRSEGYRLDADRKEELEQFIEDLKKKTEFNSVGVYLKEEQKRYYPNNRLASHLLGYLSQEGEAVGGIEMMFNEQLTGTDGDITRKKDRRGVELPDSKVSFTPPVDGNDLELTIDQNIQFYTETALRQAYDRWKPKNLTAIAVDPKTMEILSMASIPDFNPNRYWEVNGQSDFINHAISSQYEPGSTFKLVTLAGAIEEGLFDPEAWFQSGTLQVPGAPVHDHNRAGWGSITYMEGLLRSSNVAFAKLGYEGLKKDRLQDYIDRFGFGQKTGIELPNEVSGKIHMQYPSDIARATFGQGQVTVTALQQVTAYAAVANEGKLMKPYLVRNIRDRETQEVVQSFGPQEVAQVVSPETAKETGLYLEQTVANQELGTGRIAYIDGYRVAGKSGTANIVPEGSREYSRDTWLVSFIGYAPVDNPQVLIAVLVNQPDLKGNYQLGGEVATSVFREIMTQTLSYLNIPPSISPSERSDQSSARVMPDITGISVENAKARLSQVGLQASTLGEGSKVTAQYPAAGLDVSTSQQVYLATSDPSKLPIPDLKGKSMREAMEICSFLEVQCVTKGQGYVKEQSNDTSARKAQLQLRPLTAEEEAASDPDESSEDSSEDSSENSEGEAPDEEVEHEGEAEGQAETDSDETPESNQDEESS
ncbi:penicillin-binding transpeptidase domain-containing protein [Paenibacillus senegalensis]|uniref:penicillin-binding transpeptidase domain-containing protein n=1 Tax=Paenibacillus senegalensis TaxID=1465766 RepID=UPI00138B0D90|nr:penicillin-binding transpeptidase domain-containing protein [Paenibacillus senegalensis]